MNKKMVPLKIEATIKYPEDIVTGFQFASKILSAKDCIKSAMTEGLYMNEVLVFNNQEVILERWADHPHFCLYTHEIKKIPNYKNWEFHYETNYVRKQYVQLNKILEYCVVSENNDQIQKHGQKYILEFRNELVILERCSLELIEKALNSIIEDIQYVSFSHTNTELETKKDNVQGNVCFGHEGELVNEMFKVIAPELFCS